MHIPKNIALFYLSYQSNDMYYRSHCYCSLFLEVYRAQISHDMIYAREATSSHFLYNVHPIIFDRSLCHVRQIAHFVRYMRKALEPLKCTRIMFNNLRNRNNSKYRNMNLKQLRLQMHIMNGRVTHVANGRVTHVTNDRVTHVTNGRVTHVTNDRVTHVTNDRVTHVANGRVTHVTNGKVTHVMNG